MCAKMCAKARKQDAKVNLKKDLSDDKSNDDEIDSENLNDTPDSDIPKLTNVEIDSDDEYDIDAPVLEEKGSDILPAQTYIQLEEEKVVQTSGDSSKDKSNEATNTEKIIIIPNQSKKIYKMINTSDNCKAESPEDKFNKVQYKVKIHSGDQINSNNTNKSDD